MRVEEMARRFGKTPAQVRAVMRPLMEDLRAFCESDGGDEACARFRATPGGRALRDALRTEEVAALKARWAKEDEGQ